MDSTQIFLTMTFLPDAMQGVKMIATETPQLRQILGLDEKQKYISFADVLADGQYLLQNYVEEANLKSPASRNAFEKMLSMLISALITHILSTPERHLESSPITRLKITNGSLRLMRYPPLWHKRIWQRQRSF